MTPPVPQRVGRFDIQEPLGAGGMGVVYRARDTHLNRDVAVKLLAGDLTADAGMVRRFEQEARAASALNHPNIVTVFDAGLDGQTAYIVTELLHGTTLGDRIGGRPLPVETALDAAVQIAAALAAAHAAGIVHRDIKPQNIFVTRSGVVKLLDFGIARLVTLDPAEASRQATQAAATRAGDIVGTPAYMAPEQIRGQQVDARTDIFAFGCVLHEMLTGVSPFARATGADVMAAVLAEPAAPPAASIGLPRQLERILARCLAKDPDDRFQSAADLRFSLETARQAVTDGRPGLEAKATGPRRALTVVLTLGVVVAAAWLAWTLTATMPGPVVIQASTVVPASARPIAPAISPDGRWVSYIGLAGGAPNLYVQFLNSGAPVRITQDADLPLQNRTIVGGIDILPDGSGIAVGGRPRPSGLWQVPGIWIVPAPLGGPARRLSDRYASVRWSPDGRQIAAVIANPLVGDAVALAAADGQDERILVPAAGGMHLHQVAWGHDGRYVYYSRTLEPNHALGEIYRVAVTGGTPEAVVRTQGTAMFPAPTPDGRALIYAGDRGGDGMNIWWHPLDGSAERRLTTGAGEFTEPFISRDGHHLVVLARRRRSEIVRVDAQAVEHLHLDAPSAESIEGSDPSASRSTDRLFFTSIRNGRRKIWSTTPDGRTQVPLTFGSDDDRRPVASADGRQVAFVSNRNGRRGIWIVSADGGTPRALVPADVIDYITWAPDSRRIVYAAAGADQATLWVADASGGSPRQIPARNARVPAWSPVAEQIAFVSLIQDKPFVNVMTPDGHPVREPIAIDPVSLPTAVAWSPDGTRLGLVNLPGRAAAEAWVLDLATGQLRKVAELLAPAEFEGLSWTRDGRALLLGRSEFESEVLLLEIK